MLKKIAAAGSQGFKNSVFQLFQFGCIGLVSSAVSLGTYYIVLSFNAGLYQLGNFLGWAVSVAGSYLLNRRFVFKERTENRFWVGLSKSYMSYGASYLISTLLLFLEIEFLGWPETISPVINIVVMFPVNFLFNKYFTFRKKNAGIKNRNEEAAE